jgi:hypothetical protein
LDLEVIFTSSAVRRDGDGDRRGATFLTAWLTVWAGVGLRGRAPPPITALTSIRLLSHGPDVSISDTHGRTGGP